MNLGDMINEYRTEADDFVEPPMCSDNEIRTWVNQGCKEAARRKHIIVDSSTDSCCKINVVAGTAEYKLDSKVIFVDRVRVLEVDGLVLRPVKMELMDVQRPGWESDVGEPMWYVVGLNTHKIRLYPIPDKNYTLNLTVKRLPLVDLELPSDEPEFPEEYHQAIVQWVLFRAFSKKDVEIFDAERAAEAKRSFEEEFGTKEDANAGLEQQRLNQQTYVFNSGAY
jgi:hypothetical protein